MTGRILGLSLIGALGFALAGCGGTKTVTVTRTVTVSPALITAPVRVYFLRDGKVAPVARRLPVSRDSLLKALATGPTPAEKSIGLTAPSQSSLAQTVYTLSQFDPAASVEVAGKRYTRADFEDETPAILVESPLAFETVHGPALVASGTANTFEATFEYELLDADGKVLASHFVTATSGTGTRGTFDFSVPFSVPHAESGKLVVFERSAENGKRIHEVEIPLTLAP
jgi:Immunoglobulin-like domain of bacterial spore germination